MSVVVVVLAISGLAAVAIERAIRCGAAQRDAAVSLASLEGYAEAVEQLKRDYERLQAATLAAIRAAESALEHGDPRDALDALAGVPESASRRLSEQTSVLLARAAATAVARAEQSGELRGRRGLLGRLARAGDSAVGDPSPDLDEAGGGLQEEQR